MDKDLGKEERNIAERGLSLDLAESLDWATALIWEDTRKDYGESRYCVLGLIADRLNSRRIQSYPPMSACAESGPLRNN